MNPYMRVIDAFNKAGVRYIVVGGFAAVLHGHNRFTADLDMVLDLAPAEARRAISTLLALGFTPGVPVDAIQFADPAVRNRWVEEKGMMVLSMHDPGRHALVVDLFARPPLDFALLLADAVEIPVSGKPVVFAASDI
jgi:hypothetical protein